MNGPRKFQRLELPRGPSSKGWNFAAATLASLLGLAALPAVALHQPLPDIDPKSGIAVTLESAFETVPPLGYAPLRLVVKNDSDRERTWSFAFESTTYYDNRHTFSSSASVSVPAKSQRIVEVMAPLASVHDGYAYPQLNVSVFGYGAGSGSRYRWSAGGPRYSSGGYTPFTAMSDTLGTTAWGPLESLVRTGGVELVGTQFDAAKAPGDHRGWLGCDAVWLAASDWEGLEPAQKQALLDWVKLGGRLQVCTSTSALERPVDLPREEDRIGFGELQYIVSKDNSSFVANAAKKVRHGDRLATDLSSGYETGWGLRSGIPPIVVNAALIMLFVCVFAAVVGPINLFMLARRQKHLHLFWTTPALSIAASLLLALLIILQDGFGGRGHRLNVVYLDAAQHKAYTLQEQVSRTGVLLSRDIPTRDPFYMTAVKLDAKAKGGSSRYTATDTQLSGDWFASRTVQGHLLVAVQPTRARVEFADDAGTPVAISSMGATLADLFYRDAQGDYWRAQELQTGERKRMKKVESKEFDAWRSGAVKLHGGRLRKVFTDYRGHKDCFYAAVDGTTEQCIPTLPSIRWTQQSLVYFGPAEHAGAPAKGGKP